MHAAYFINTPQYGTYSPEKPWLVCDCGDGYVLKVYGLPFSVQGHIELHGMVVISFGGDASQDDYAEAIIEAEKYLATLYFEHKHASVH